MSGAQAVNEGHEARPRGRPTANRAARMEETIFDAALEIFLERGVEGATIEGVAERARVSKGTVYARFPGKDALFRKVIERQIETWSRAAGRFDHLMPDDTAGRLRYHCRTLHRMFGSEEVQRFTRLVEQAAGDFPELAAFWLEAGAHRYRDLIARNLAAVAQDAAGRDWSFIAELVVHALSGWLRTESMLRMPSDEEVRAYIEKLVATVLRIAGQPAGPDDHKGL